MSITSTLFPPSNREAAFVAFLRTFWQVVRPPIVLGSLSLGAIGTTGVVHLDLRVLGIIAGATVLSAILSGLLAAGDILKNGLPDAYTSAAVASIPAAVVAPAIPAPVDPSQPAAGTSPSFQDIIAPPVAPAVIPAADAAPAAPVVTA